MDEKTELTPMDRKQDTDPSEVRLLCGEVQRISTDRFHEKFARGDWRLIEYLVGE